MWVGQLPLQRPVSDQGLDESRLNLNEESITEENDQNVTLEANKVEKKEFRLVRFLQERSFDERYVMTF